MKQRLLAFLIAAVSLSITAQGAELTPLKRDMHKNLDALQSVIRTAYAPYAWKAKFSGWNLDQEIEKAKQEVQNTNDLTIKGYQQIVRKLFSSMKDYHVGVQFHSTESARLPFWLKRVGDRYFLTFIDRTKVSEASFPFQEGDELVLMGTKKPHELVTALKPLLGSNTEETDWALATLYLTNRTGRLGLPMEKGPVLLTLKRKGSDRLVKHQLHWEHTPERITSPRSWSIEPADAMKQLLQKQMVLADYSAIKAFSAAENNHALGAKKSYVHALGEKEWESGEGDAFHAYVYKSPAGKKIGYIRIPSYIGSEYHAVAFGTVLKRFEEDTDALVIDQVNNPGGYVFYLYALASMLTDTAISTPRHAMAITQVDVASATEIFEKIKDIKNDEEARKVVGSSLQGYPVDYQFVLFLKGFCEFIVDQWNSGKRLTDPQYLYGVDFINPHPVNRYTKPVMIVTNELDFSGGDFFPAILQDNKRVTIFGTRTAGAGGYVQAATLPNAFGILGFSLTGSLAERVDLKPIENLGVKPDVEYALTAEDVQNGYQGYTKAINQSVEALVK